MFFMKNTRAEGAAKEPWGRAIKGTFHSGGYCFFLYLLRAMVFSQFVLWFYFTLMHVQVATFSSAFDEDA